MQVLSDKLDAVYMESCIVVARVLYRRAGRGVVSADDAGIYKYSIAQLRRRSKSLEFHSCGVHAACLDHAHLP